MMNIKKFLIILSYLFTGLSQASESQISWSYQKTTFHGTRSFVLKLTNTMAEIYKTKTGEILIHGLKLKGPKFQVFLTNGELIYGNNAERTLEGSIESSKPDSLFPILLEVLEEEFGSNLGLTEAAFITELQEAKEFESIFEAFPFITVRAAPVKLERMKDTLEKIAANPVGYKLFEDMKACQKELLIYDDKHSLSGGGYTGAVKASSGIFKGEGENAYIRFRFDQPDSGAHIVGTMSPTREKIPFLYIDNIFHELVHAKHIMCGTMSFSGSEAQAIYEENIFRASRPETRDWPKRDSRQYEVGVQVWFGYHPHSSH